MAKAPKRNKKWADETRAKLSAMPSGEARKKAIAAAKKVAPSKGYAASTVAGWAGSDSESSRSKASRQAAQSAIKALSPTGGSITKSTVSFDEAKRILERLVADKTVTNADLRSMVKTLTGVAGKPRGTRASHATAIRNAFFQRDRMARWEKDTKGIGLRPAAHISISF